MINPITLTQKLLALRTMNPPGDEHECAHYIGRILEDGGFHVVYHEFEDRRTCLIASLDGQGRKPPIGFSGHMDTVPLGLGPWEKDPFAGLIEGDRIYGRGSSDMKGGLAAMMTATLRISEKGPGKGGLKLVFTADEERGSRGAHDLSTRTHLLGEAGALIVGEPTANLPVIGHKGALWVEIETTGVTAHGSMPEQGDNAILKAARVVEQLRHFPLEAPPNPLFGSSTLNIGTIHGGVNINSVPDRTRIGVDIRTIPGQTNQGVIEKLRAYLGEGVTVGKVLDVDGVSTDPEHPWVRSVFDLTTSSRGQQPAPQIVTYFTDAAFLKPAFNDPPTLLLGPGEPRMAHKTDEFCHVSKIEEAAETYFQIARQWCEL